MAVSRPFALGLKTIDLFFAVFVENKSRTIIRRQQNNNAIYSK
jgi:hypothetical protein